MHARAQAPRQTGLVQLHAKFALINILNQKEVKGRCHYSKQGQLSRLLRLHAVHGYQRAVSPELGTSGSSSALDLVVHL